MIRTIAIVVTALCLILWALSVPRRKKAIPPDFITVEGLVTGIDTAGMFQQGPVRITLLGDPGDVIRGLNTAGSEEGTVWLAGETRFVVLRAHETDGEVLVIRDKRDPLMLLPTTAEPTPNPEPGED